MKTIIIGQCDLVFAKDILEKFINEVYNHFYKKERLRHITRGDKRLPKIKITSDIFSLSIWIKDKAKKEHRIFLDGTVKLNELRVNSITLDGEEFMQTEYQAIFELFKQLSAFNNGFILLSIDNGVYRIKNGDFNNQNDLLKELFNISPENRTKEQVEIYDWITSIETDDL